MRSLVAALVFAAPVLAQSERFLSVGALAGVNFRQTLASTNAPQSLDCGPACLVGYGQLVTACNFPKIFDRSLQPFLK